MTDFAVCRFLDRCMNAIAGIDKTRWDLRCYHLFIFMNILLTWIFMDIQEHSWTISGLGFKTWLLTSLCSHEICSPLRHRDGANTLHATFINNITCICMTFWEDLRRCLDFFWAPGTTTDPSSSFGFLQNHLTLCVVPLKSWNILPLQQKLKIESGRSIAWYLTASKSIRHSI